MEKNTQENENRYCNSCKGNAMNCQCYGMHHHSILRILIALVILGFVFIGGMKLGELKAEVAMIYQNNGQQQMGYGRMYGGYGMMGTTTLVSPAHPVVPATATVTTAPAVAQ
jgi:hypothetical protein